LATSRSWKKLLSLKLWPVFNLAPRGEIWPIGVRLAPRGELCLLGVKILCSPIYFSKESVFTYVWGNEGVSIHP
jgi:hypothetical protein